jgi:hypothetical protein
MEALQPMHTVGQAIEAAIAPVFLIVGIAGLLNMLSGRLGRVIDRTRVVRDELCRAGDDAEPARLQLEMKLLRRRIELANWSIRACVSSAFVVCVLVVALFVNDFVDPELAGLVAGLFIIAMLLIIAGLLLILIEVTLASRQASRALGEG